MKKLYSFALAASAILPVFWYQVIPQEYTKKWCAKDGSGCYIEYSVIRQDRMGKNQVLRFDNTTQEQLCPSIGM
jgi:hypothetical protein